MELTISLAMVDEVASDVVLGGVGVAGDSVLGVVLGGRDASLPVALLTTFGGRVPVLWSSMRWCSGLAACSRDVGEFPSNDSSSSSSSELV